jgi:hypothetical protein
MTTAGGVNANGIARWDGASWSALGSGMADLNPSPHVTSLAVMPNGDLAAGGYFGTAGGVAAKYIARWEGASWSALGSGMNGGVSALAVLSNGDLAACGVFTTAGGNASAYFARYTFGHPCCGSADFNCDGDVATDADIEAFFACVAGTCPSPPCVSTADFNGDGDVATDADIEAFFRVLAGGTC